MVGDFNKVNIMDIPFENSTKNQFLKEVIERKLVASEKCFIVTANPEIVMETRRNPQYKKVVLSADYVVPDGTGVLFAAKYKRQPLTERIAGFDLMNDMLQLANDQGASCYFLGASEEANKVAVEKIVQKYPNIIVAGKHHGYFKGENEEVSLAISEANADFVFVALGFPRQELWIQNNMGNCEKGIFIGVGGSLDVFAGKVKRAPNFWIKLNLEWLYRVLRQPRRLKRLIPIAQFILLVLFRKA